MSATMLKSLILIIPTVTVGLWEWLRHTLLLPYISMEAGNWLTPFIVLSVTMTLVLKLFSQWEDIQKQLQDERSMNAALGERERLARELHDGIAQSLFLLSVKTDKLAAVGGVTDSQIDGMRRSVRELNEYVRGAIAGLREAEKAEELSWQATLEKLSADFEAETGIHTVLTWTIPEELLHSREKVELYASIREALMNIRKHARASEVQIQGQPVSADSWSCTVADNGVGLPDDQARRGSRYGLLIIEERARELGWSFRLYRDEASRRTIVEVKKKG